MCFLKSRRAIWKGTLYSWSSCASQRISQTVEATAFIKKSVFSGISRHCQRAGKNERHSELLHGKFHLGDNADVVHLLTSWGLAEPPSWRSSITCVSSCMCNKKQQKGQAPEANLTLLQGLYCNFELKSKIYPGCDLAGS